MLTCVLVELWIPNVATLVHYQIAECVHWRDNVHAPNLLLSSDTDNQVSISLGYFDPVHDSRIVHDTVPVNDLQFVLGGTSLRCDYSGEARLYYGTACNTVEQKCISIRVSFYRISSNLMTDTHSRTG